MAVVATLSKGYDLDYIWKQVDRGPAKDAASYYIQASESGGEPPGRWWGPGAKALGFEPGQTVEREPYDLLFGERKAPDGTQLGRPPGNGRKAADLYAQLLAAEPHATAERKRELRTEAVKKARQSPLFFDLTISLSKSISIFHASLGENARLARQAGDHDGDAYWSALVGEVDDMIWQAVHAGFGYFQREAGYTRTGSHGTRVHGRETGQWHEADLAVAHWLQHTSRDGDMQLHVHSQIAHVARTGTDGKWRAPDSLGYNEHIGAVAAIVSQHLEEALTARFGLEWTARDDGHGFEIKGITGEMMRVFSSRRESITADLRGRAARFEQRYGRAPSQRELAHLAQASNFKTRATPSTARWISRRRTRAGRTSSRARSASRWRRSRRRSGTAAGRAGAHARGPGSPAPVPAELELARAAQKAVALAQQEKSAWTRADVIKYLGRVLPRTGLDPAAAAALLEDLADRALRSEFEPVTCLEAPELAEVPRSLLRADGRSVYQRHGGTRYATRAQLAMEERMVAQAERERRAAPGPRASRARARRGPGAARGRAGRTRARRARRAGRAHGQRAARGPGRRRARRADRRPARLGAQRAGRVREDPGAGRGRADLGRAGLGPVIGITPSQSARNTLAAGVPVSYNAAQFLGHLPGRRGARGPVPIGPGTLLVIDEASMLSGPDLADLIAYAKARGAKIILAGDTSQLQAVENGGGMSLLAGALGYARLAEPVRFRHAWEQAASLRLRDGDTTVLAEYDQHGRIIGGDPEQMMDAAAAAYVALTAGGTDTLLMAADHALRRELNRRIRDDLITLGIVQPGPAVTIADGTQASPGDLIICTRNDHSVEAGEPGRTLANGDLLRIDAITADGLLVRRALDADPRTGQRRWTARAFRVRRLPGCRARLRGHRPRRPGPHRAHRPGRDHRDRGPPARLRRADPRHRRQPRLRVHRTRPRPPTRLPARGRLPNWPGTTKFWPNDPASPPRPPSLPRRARRWACSPAVLDHDGQQHSATQTRNQALADADHLALLHAIWTAETTPAREQRYRDLLMNALPPGHRAEPGHQARWLWRTLRAAELAGLDPARVLAEAIAERDLAGSRDIAGRHRRPPPPPPRLPGPAAVQAVVRSGPRHRRPRTPRLRHRDRGADGRPQGPDRRARRRARPALGDRRPRAGARAPGGPAGVAAARGLDRRVPGTIRLRRPGRPDRARTRRGRAGPAGGLV